MNKTFATIVHFVQTSAAGANAKHDVTVNHNANITVITTSGVTGKCIFSLLENIHDTQVSIAII